MSIFNDLKRVFFGAKSVAKHQASKAEGKVREAGRDGADAAEELAGLTKDAALDVISKAPGYVAKGKDALEDLTDKIWREADTAADKGRELKDRATDSINMKLGKKTDDEEIGAFEGFDLGTPGKPGQADRNNSAFGDLTVSEPPRKPGDKSPIDFESDFLDDAKSKASKAAAKANEFVTPSLDAAAKAGLAAKVQAGKIANKIGDLSEVVGKKVLEKGDEALDRAAQAGSEAKDKFDDFVNHADVEAKRMKAEEAVIKAQRAAEQAEARATAFGGKEGARDTSESTLSGTDSFFDRADRFAKGDYQNEGGKEMTIGKNPNPEEKPKGGKIAGFLDSDGDGDSLIDDAIIDED
ncbi:hypothetical protein [Neolewinella antarctica]|uniref:Uncharacterized protein n=1 Tax=Neolewinella antarctica TaxID=442734 RepID=A0ABX0X5X2_9BACT|nr:hypothetical protein [Neolewinella antarctica]NJC24595.1 hypothetical protein [Neolewinella antarctica]